MKKKDIIVILRRNLVEDAAQRVENEITQQIEDFYWRLTPKADGVEHYRELKDAEEELARWLLGYLTEPWLLNYVRASLIAQKSNPADDDLPDELQEWIKDLPADTSGLRPAYRREQVWLRWNENEELGPAAIRDRWNGLGEVVRKKISPRQYQTLAGEKATAANRVSQGLIRARQDNQNSRRKQTPKTTRRSTSRTRKQKT
jgi:hypothetical protein